ncbi:hypothetical protein PYW07_008738 [Mythimna separata]|uniref:Ketoreductase domain-containing protein n=1 Tax=Mythimna separata TaxID=271217 RepID=A0AAD8DNF7_MYTSE|nr:hypothetical protein PYW07_008738 [Mythimna separata]
MFANKVVIVTGSSGGIGAATVELFAKEGASVAIVGRNEEKLKEVAKRCEQHGASTLIIKADVSKEEEAKTIVQKTIDKFGKLDVLVNNAGILRFGNILQPNFLQNYDEVMNTNMRPVILITNLAIPHLIETKGNIVNMSSVLSASAKIPGTMSYSISKAAMDQFTRFVAVELAPSGVRVNSVNPGPVITDIAATAGLSPEELQSINPAAMTLFGRSSVVDEIREVVLYLASDKAKSVTGSCYVIDNGFLLK